MSYTSYLVSIIVPVYNAQEYLQKCLNSLVSQRYKDIEIILVDDGSTDSSVQICYDYVKKDKRIHVIESENGGPSSARNLGIDYSNGSLIYFMDADDYIDDRAISRLVEEYIKSKAQLVIGDYKKVLKDTIITSGHSRYFNKATVLNKMEILAYVRKYLSKPNRYPLFVYSWGRLFEAEIIKKNSIRFNINLRTYEDVSFNYEYLKYVDKLLFLLDDAFYFHVLHDDFSSHSLKIFDKPENLLGYQEAFKNIKKYTESFDINIDQEIGNAFISYTVIQLVRMCGQLSYENRELIYQTIDSIVNDNNIRNKLKYYKPTGGDSKIVPILIKLKFSKAVLHVCEYKANKRYRGK